MRRKWLTGNQMNIQDTQLHTASTKLLKKNQTRNIEPKRHGRPKLLLKYRDMLLSKDPKMCSLHWILASWLESLSLYFVFEVEVTANYRGSGIVLSICPSVRPPQDVQLLKKLTRIFYLVTSAPFGFLSILIFTKVC